MDTTVLHTMQLTLCPALVGDEDNPRMCSAPIRLMAYRLLSLDDYGEFATIRIAFECGHTIEEMVRGLTIE